MKHKLQLNAGVICKFEASLVVLPINHKFLGQAYQHLVQPSQQIRTVIILCLEYCDSCHQCRCSLSQ